MAETADKRAPVDRDGPVIRKSIGAPTERDGGPVLRRVINGGSATKLPSGRPEARTRVTCSAGGVGIDPIAALALLVAVLALVML